MEFRRFLYAALPAILLTVASGTGPALADDAEPALMDREDLAGKMFSRPDMLKLTEDGNTTLDVTSFLSSDERFGSGMYRSGPVRYEIDEPYGVDEFMYFLEGGVKLTSSDGSVQVVKAGEAVTIAKEWTGIWETEGYTKIWVIYSDDGSAFE